MTRSSKDTPRDEVLTTKLLHHVLLKSNHEDLKLSTSTRFEAKA